MPSVAWRQIHCRRLDRINVTRTSRQYYQPTRLRPLNDSRPILRASGAIRICEIQMRHASSFFDTGLNTIARSRQQSEEAILQRASIHGIDSLERLAAEADLESARRSHRNLVYDSSIRQDLDLWAILLDYRKLKDGSRGVRAVLNAMLYAGEPVKLQTDMLSEHIWCTILPTVLKDEKLLHELCQNSSSFILERPSVFTDVVGPLLAGGDFRLAVVAGTQLLVSRFKGRSDLLHLFDVAIQTNSTRTIQGFCHLVSRLPLHRIYADVVPKMCSAGRLHDAFLVHRQLLSLGDLPTRFDQLAALVRELATRKIGVEPFVRHLESNGVYYSHQTRQLYALEKTSLALQLKKPADLMLHQGPGLRPVKLSDQFVARTFATRSVSFDFILNGLRFVGLFEIGPLAVREIALASDDISVLKKRFQQLEDMHVDLGASNYTRVIKNLCFSDQQGLLHEILESDMHYEVFEDVQKQKRLLAEYYQTKNWSGVNWTLAILNEGRTDKESDLRSARLLLQTCLVLGDWRGALRHLDDLRKLRPDSMRRTKLAPLRLALRRIWTAVGPQQRREDDFLERSRYLVGFMQLAQLAGLHAHPWQWRSVIHAVGRSGNWALCKSLMLSLARTYQEPETEGDKKGNTVLARLFDGAMQASIVELGLVSNDRHQGPGQLWLQGAEVLFELGHRHGLQIDYSTVMEAFKSRLLVLFNDPDIKLQRQFVVSYLRCFNWAWRHCAQRYGKDIQHKLYQRGWQNPDMDSVRLYQLRARVVRQRRESLVGRNSTATRSDDFADIDAEFKEMEWEEGETMEDTLACDHHSQSRAPELQDNAAVFYEDLLHPSFTRLSDAKR